VAETRAQYPEYELCDVAHNFFVGRTKDVLAMGGWDEELKLNEHVEFFVRVQRHNMRVGYCADVVAWHWMERNPAYTIFRNRDFTALAARKIGVRTVIGFDGLPVGSGAKPARRKGSTENFGPWRHLAMPKSRYH